MYIASTNLVKHSNERIVKYEQKQATDNKQIKELSDKHDTTVKQTKVMKDG